MASSPSTPQSITCVMQPNPSLLYRQVDYYDGKNVCIAESRRRPHVIQTEMTTSPPTRVHPRVSRHTQAVLSMEYASNQATSIRNPPSDKEPRFVSHVTSKSRRTQAETVIVQAPVRNKLSGAWVIPQVNVKDIRTRPPTPKIKRLPTPDLEDLDERRFCDCCIQGHVFKFCTGCGRDLDSLEC